VKAAVWTSWAAAGLGIAKRPANTRPAQSGVMRRAERIIARILQAPFSVKTAATPKPSLRAKLAQGLLSRRATVNSPPAALFKMCG